MIYYNVVFFNCAHIPTHASGVAVAGLLQALLLSISHPFLLISINSLTQRKLFLCTNKIYTKKYTNP